MQKSYFAVRWVALLFALACALALPTALYAAAEKAPVTDAGLIVVALDPAGPAAAAGVKRGDIILAVDGNPVNTIADLMTVLATLPPETTVTLQVQHGDEVAEVAVTPAVRAQRAYLGILPYAEPTLDIATSAPPTPPLPPVQQSTPLQAVPALPPVPDVTEQTVTMTRSLVVVEVMPGSAAAAAGLQPQDLITAVDGSSVTAPDALQAHLASLQPGDTITLTITRGDEAPRAVMVKVGKGSTGQALLGVKLGVAVTTTLASQGEAHLAAPAVPSVEKEFYHFRQAPPFYQWTMPAPGCMSDGDDMAQGQSSQNFVQRQPGTLMIAPMASGQWVAQPALPAEQNAVVVVQGQVGQEFTQMAEPVQQGIVIVSPAQSMAAPLPSALPNEQGNVIILNNEATSVQPAPPITPTVGDYY